MVYSIDGQQNLNWSLPSMAAVRLLLADGIGRQDAVALCPPSGRHQSVSPASGETLSAYRTPEVQQSVDSVFSHHECIGPVHRAGMLWKGDDAVNCSDGGVDRLLR